MAGAIASLATVILTFPDQVGKIIDLAINNVGNLNILSRLDKKRLQQNIIDFDTEHNTRTLLVELLPDGGYRVIWLNPERSGFWYEHDVRLSKIYYPRSEAHKLEINQCFSIQNKDGIHVNHVCFAFGRLYAVVVVADPGVDLTLETARLTWLIERQGHRL